MPAPAATSATAPAVVLALLLAGAGVAVGTGSFAAEAVDPTGPRFALEGRGSALAAEIAGRNLGAALLLFSGVVTLGTTAAVGTVFVAAWVGAGVRAMSLETGLRHLDPLVLTYLPLELGGLLLAAVAGLLPLAAVGRRVLADGPAASVAAPVVPTALRLLALGVLLVLAGAVAETAVIHHSTLEP